MPPPKTYRGRHVQCGMVGVCIIANLDAAAMPNQFLFKVMFFFIFVLDR